MKHCVSCTARTEYHDKPAFLYGESMGGAVAINISRADSGKWDGMILVAPMCKVSMSTQASRSAKSISRVRRPVQTFS